MREQKFIIGGEWRTGAETTAVRDVYNNSGIAMVHQAGEQDIEDAIQAAQRAFVRTSQYSGFERSEILRSIAAQIKERKEEFARCITAEAGKPITFSRSEVDRAVLTFEIASEEAKRIYGETIPLDISRATMGKHGIVNSFPIGIILCITPFNFPLNLVAHKLAPAIAAGNTFILKPPPQTPLTSMLLGEVLLKSGLEQSSVNILPVSNERAGRLIADDRIALLSFTGSAKVGWMLKNTAGKKKVVLELGGNAAVIVDSSANIPHAVSRCVLGAFGYAGQVCIKVQRIMVHDSVFDQFQTLFAEETMKVITGDPNDEKTLAGPMISEYEAMRVESWVSESLKEGTTVVTGGVRNGKFYAPTVLTDVQPTMKVCSEEIFGPVVTLERYSKIEEAIVKVNDSKYGLQAGIFSNDLSSVQNVYQHLNVGGLIVNDYPTFRVDNMPYGGVKDSGLGREGVRYAMAEMMEKKLLVI